MYSEGRHKPFPGQVGSNRTDHSSLAALNSSRDSQHPELRSKKSQKAKKGASVVQNYSGKQRSAYTPSESKPVRVNLHLSNLSEATSEKHLLNYFNQFGKVVSLNIAKLPSGICRGFCKISIEIFAQNTEGKSDQELSQKIVRSLLGQDHFVNNCRINVEEFIAKKQRLAEWDDQLIKCRISVRNIPEDNFGDLELSQIFRGFFGPIRNAYIR